MKRAWLFGLCLAVSAIFTWLGFWQLDRLREKTILIARVEARVSASPQPAPDFAKWSPDDAYTRVWLEGSFLHDREARVLAVTDLGPGWWIVTPLETSRGYVLVNRGFAPQAMDAGLRQGWERPVGLQHVTGLLRATEPDGGFLRANAPDEDRWYSRDVQAIAGARKLTPVAPYFVDVEADRNDTRYPRGGLTVVNFPNTHLIYAITWFALAILCVAGGAILLRARPSPG